jgi:epoxyqueuosine reductase QueG
MKDAIRKFVLDLGVDDVGFAAVSDYQSPRSPAIESLFPGAKSIIVLAFHELSACESPSPLMAMNARIDLTEFSRSASYRVARFVESNYGSPAMTASISYPMDLRTPEKIGIAEVSLRHAAVAAGLGALGRHNLVVHPRFGTRVLFAAVLTQLELGSTPQVKENPCTDCGLCVTNCPAGALATEGKTDFLKCMAVSQPYGMRASIGFWTRFGAATVEERSVMLTTPEYLSLYQASSLGLQYYCFRCLAVCPVGKKVLPKEDEAR